MIREDRHTDRRGKTPRRRCRDPVDRPAQRLRRPQTLGFSAVAHHDEEFVATESDGSVS